MDELFINVAEICQSTRALGPGLRAAIWVQGCPIHCVGCIAPDWIPFKKANILTPEEAAEKLLLNPDLDGITISGGEPMLQAIGLAAMLQHIRAKKMLHVICFTGFKYENLIKWHEKKKIKEFLAEIDILIDGPYIENLNNGLTFAGSSNQRIIRLSPRVFNNMNDWTPRKMEMHIRKRNILAVGIPPGNWEKVPSRFSPLDSLNGGVQPS